MSEFEIGDVVSIKLGRYNRIPNTGKIVNFIEDKYYCVEDENGETIGKGGWLASSLVLVSKAELPNSLKKETFAYSFRFTRIQTGEEFTVNKNNGDIIFPPNPVDMDDSDVKFILGVSRNIKQKSIKAHTELLEAEKKYKTSEEEYEIAKNKFKEAADQVSRLTRSY